MAEDVWESRIGGILGDRFRFGDVLHPLLAQLLKSAQIRLNGHHAGGMVFAVPVETESRLVMPHLADAKPSILCLCGIDSILPKVRLPSLPQVFYTLQEMAERDDVTMAQLGQIICLDPKMTCSLLKLANGGLFNVHASIDTVSAATGVLQDRGVSTQTLGTLMLGLFCERPPACLNFDLFWQHSIAVGIAARALARHTGRNNPERFFVAGLLHDVGWLALTCTQPEMAVLALEKAEEWQCPFVEAERKALGFDHARLGARLLEYWSFPPNLIAAVAYHHAPSGCPEHEEPGYVHLADVIVKAVGYGASVDCLVQPLDNAAWDALGMEPGVITTIIEELDREVAFLSRSLCIP